MSLRARVAAYRARSRYARGKSVAYKRTRTVKRRRIPRGIMSGTHSFTRYADTRLISMLGGTTGVGGAYSFKLNDVTSYAEFTSLFDQYKITKIDVMFKLHTNSYLWTATNGANTNNGAATAFPTLYLCNDHDDSTTTVTLAELKERQKTKRFVLRPNSILKWTVRPAILNQLYRTAVSTGYSPAFNKYIDCSNVDVPHYGMKFFLDYDGATLPAYIVGGTGQTIDVNVELKYHLTLKDVR